MKRFLKKFGWIWGLMIILLAILLQPVRARVLQVDSHTLAPTIELTLWHSNPSAGEAALQAVIDDYELLNPDVSISALNVDFNLIHDLYISSTLVHVGPTMVMGAQDWGPQFLADGLVVDLTDLVDPALVATILPNPLKNSTYQGRFFGIPFSTKGVLLYRNPNIVAQPASTLQQLILDAQNAAGGTVEGAFLERGFFFAAGHLPGVGGLLMDQFGCPAFDNADGVAWLNLLKSFDEAGPTSYYTNDDVFGFSSAEVGYIIDGTWGLADLRAGMGDDNLVIDPWPAPLSGYVQSDVVYLSADKSAEEQQAGLDFMEYLLDANVQLSMEQGGFLPSVSSVPVSDPLLAQAQAALAGGIPFPAIPQLESYWVSMDTALTSYFDDIAAPLPALTAAANEIRADLALRGYPCQPIYLPVTGR
jgi:arabinogalactan oligomer / maltooligosaccharide transport system substrate-binding protein